MFWSGGGAQPSRGDRKLPAPSLPETAEHLSLPNEVMSFQGTLQILSESAILELLRNEVTWKETGHGVSKGKAEIAVQALQATRVVQTSGAVHLQPTQSPLGCRTDLGVPFATVSPAPLPLQSPVATRSWGLAPNLGGGGADSDYASDGGQKNSGGKGP